MKNKHKQQLAELTARHEKLCQFVTTLRNDLDHLTAALAQRGVWDHDYSTEKIIQLKRDRDKIGR